MFLDFPSEQNRRAAVRKGARVVRWRPLHNVALRCSLLTLAALALDYPSAPILFTGSTLWAAAVWCILLLRPVFTPADRKDSNRIEPPSTQRILIFAAMHVALVLFAQFFLSPGAQSHLAPALSAAKTTAKVLVLIPTLVLLPLSSWRRLFVRFRAETIAAAVVLVTFFPWRIFEFHWDAQASLHATIVFHLAKWFIPGLSLLGGAYPALSGPRLDVVLLLACSPMQGIHIFQFLFGIAALIEWKRWAKHRLAITYTAGLAFMLAANFLRIFLMVVVGNLVSAAAVARYHGPATKVFFVFAFALFFLSVQSWLRNTPAPRFEPAILTN